MLHFTKTSLLFLTTIFLSGCFSSPEKIEHDEALDIVEHIRYVYDSKTDLCFAIIQNTAMSGTPYPDPIGMTEVPCDKVKDNIEKNSKND